MSSGHRESRLRLIAAATAITVVGMLPINLLPLLVESWIQTRGATPSAAGTVAAVELGAMAGASILLSFRVHRAPRRPLALTAGLAAAVLHLLSGWVTDLAWLPILRGAAGLAEGILLGTVAATISARPDPERLYAWVAIAGSFVAIAMWVLVPRLVADFGATGAFFAMAAVVSFAWPFFGWVPKRGPASPIDPAAPRSRGMLSRSGILLAVAGVAVATGQGAVWSFSGRIAESLQLSSAAVGWTFGGATLAGTLGAGLAAWVGLDRGRLGPLAIGFVGVLSGIALITAEPTVARFVSGQVFFALFYFFVSPYIMGLAADLDPRGRVASALSGALLIGAGMGPALGGFIVENASFATLGGVGIALTILPGLILISDKPIRQRVLRAPVGLSGSR